MLLDWLDHPEARKGAALIRAAVQRTLQNPDNRTPYMGGSLSTSELGALVICHL